MAENQSFRALKQEERKRKETEEDRPLSELQNTLPSSTLSDVSSSNAVFGDKSSQSETLTVLPPIPSSENNRDSDCPSFSELLAGAMASPVANSSPVLSSGGLDVKPTIQMVSPSVVLEPSGFKGQFVMSHQEVLASVTAQAAQAQAHMQIRVGYPSSSSELSPVSLTQSISSAITPTPLKQGLSPASEDDKVCTLEADEQNSSDQKTKPALVIVKTPSSDGYNWRKYGQKQVKGTDSSRSYYKCTYGNCHAKKKVERCDNSGHVMEIIYKGRHNHDPPRKIRCAKASGFVTSMGPVSSAGPGGGSGTIERPVRKLNNLDPSRSRIEPRNAIPEQQLNGLNECSRDACVRAAEEQGDEPYPKRRMKDISVAYSIPQFKTVKEPKIVVQAAGDVGISGDGYRWRKYGQKMVKGNPNPRSYYKCTSAGCPVRKHVERAIDDTTTIVITYEGKHDHDMPVPKKRHGPPSAALLIAAAAAMNSAQLKTSEPLARKPKTQWPMDNEGELVGEKALELGGEKALESARTLLSIGIELKPY